MKTKIDKFINYVYAPYILYNVIRKELLKGYHPSFIDNKDFQEAYLEAVQDKRLRLECCVIMSNEVN